MANQDVSMSKLGQFLQARRDRVAKLKEKGRPRLTSFIQQELRKRTAHGFETHTNPDGVNWAPLSDAYRRQKGRDDILVLTGAMKSEALTLVSTTKMAGDIWGMAMQIPYSHYHQRGFAPTMGGRHLPQRIFLGMTDDFLTLAGEAAKEEVARAFLFM